MNNYPTIILLRITLKIYHYHLYCTVCSYTAAALTKKWIVESSGDFKVDNQPKINITWEAFYLTKNFKTFETETNGKEISLESL